MAPVPLHIIQINAILDTRSLVKLLEDKDGDNELFENADIVIVHTKMGMQRKPNHDFFNRYRMMSYGYRSADICRTIIFVKSDLVRVRVGWVSRYHWETDMVAGVALRFNNNPDRIIIAGYTIFHTDLKEESKGPTLCDFIQNQFDKSFRSKNIKKEKMILFGFADDAYLGSRAESEVTKAGHLGSIYHTYFTEELGFHLISRQSSEAITNIDNIVIFSSCKALRYLDPVCKAHTFSHQLGKALVNSVFLLKFKELKKPLTRLSEEARFVL